MSRIRTIKPDFFLDDELAELSPLTRLLFVGLWTLADCEGRLEDRPRKIKAQVLPFDDGDIDTMLQTLHDRHFIIRYMAAETRCIEVRNFKKHQRITGKEAEGSSELPPRTTPGNTGETMGKQWGNNGETMGKQWGNSGETAVVQEGKGREWKGIGMEVGKGRDTDPEPTAAVEDTIKTLPVPLTAIIEAYHRLSPHTIPCLTRTPRLIHNIAERCRPDLDQLPALENWEAFFEFVNQSPLLTGKAPPRNGYPTSFVADLEWLTDGNNYRKIVEERRFHRGLNKPSHQESRHGVH